MKKKQSNSSKTNETIRQHVADRLIRFLKQKYKNTKNKIKTRVDVLLFVFVADIP